LYATQDIHTALIELRPEVGDLITISTWKLHNNESILLSPIFKITTLDNLTHNKASLDFLNKYNKSLNQSSTEVQEQIDELIQFIAECFAKNVEYGNNYDYFFSAYFANKIFNEIDNGIVEAIVYPSVQAKLKFSNIAIKPEAFDKKYRLIDVSESSVDSISTKNGSGYSLKGRGDTSNIDNNKIIW
jgi:hypothetical protein